MHSPLDSITHILGICTHPYTGARVSSIYARTHVPMPRRLLSKSSAAFLCLSLPVFGSLSVYQLYILVDLKCCTCIMSDNVLAVGLFWRNDLGCASVVPSEQTSSSYIILDVTLVENEQNKKEKEREREIMKCEPVELSFDKHFSSTFSPLDQAFQRCCTEVTLNL